MCDVQSVATGLAAGASLASGVMQRNTADFNAKQSERQAAADRAAAAQEAEKKKRDVRRVIGAQRAGFARAGVRSDVGTPAAVMAETAREGQEDIDNILQTGKLQAEAAEGRAESSRMQGRTGLIVGALGAGEEIADGFIADRFMVN